MVYLLTLCFRLLSLSLWMFDISNQRTVRQPMSFTETYGDYVTILPCASQTANHFKLNV